MFSFIRSGYKCLLNKYCQWLKIKLRPVKTNAGYIIGRYLIIEIKNLKSIYIIEINNINNSI